MKNNNKGNKMEKLEVWLDDIVIKELVGFLYHQNNQFWFEYSTNWLEFKNNFEIDPNLPLIKGSFYADKGENFGIFNDSSPDRWGRNLIKRKEIILSKKENRKINNLYEWDFFVGINDFARQGALRFKNTKNDEFVANDNFLKIPPLNSLRELENSAFNLTKNNLNEKTQEEKWLNMLIAPGSSLGGARPKSNFLNIDNSLWIAKFPSSNDDYDVGKWEFLVYLLAKEINIDVAPAKLLKLNSQYHTFCTKRFDRINDKRVFYASALTMLNTKQNENMSYLDIAFFISCNNFKNKKLQLTELFKRVVFNVLIQNKDDHLRNHGFLYIDGYFYLSPAFDININLDKIEHVLKIDEYQHNANIDDILKTAEYYDLSIDEAKNIIKNIIEVLQNWENIAIKNKLQFNQLEKDILDKNIFQPLNDYAKNFVKINTIPKKTKQPHP